MRLWLGPRGVVRLGRLSDRRAVRTAPGRLEFRMVQIPIPVVLPAEACEVALGPNTDWASLRPASRAAIKRAPRHDLGIAYCTVSCAADEAQDLLQYFQTTVDMLSARGDARASACAVALDNLRLALRLAGLS